MTTTTATALRQNENGAQPTAALLPHLDELGLNLVAHGLGKNHPVPQPVTKETPRAPSSETTAEICLVIQPQADPCLVFRFCQSVRKITGAEIAFFTSSPKGTTIKLAPRNQVAILDILTEMEEVDKAGQEVEWAEQSDLNLPPFLNLHTLKAVRVALKAL